MVLHLQRLRKCDTSIGFQVKSHGYLWQNILKKVIEGTGCYVYIQLSKQTSTQNQAKLNLETHPDHNLLNEIPEMCFYIDMWCWIASRCKKMPWLASNLCLNEFKKIFNCHTKMLVVICGSKTKRKHAVDVSSSRPQSGMVHLAYSDPILSHIPHCNHNK